MLRFVEDLFPLVIAVSPMQGWDEAAVRQMATTFDGYWARKQRYAMITATPEGSAWTSAQGRKRIVDWANSPRVKEMSTKYCVASSTIVANTWMRGAMTAVLWLWTPPSPHLAAPGPAEAVDFCLHHLKRTEVRLPLGTDETRQRALALLREA